MIVGVDVNLRRITTCLLDTETGVPAFHVWKVPAKSAGVGVVREWAKVFRNPSPWWYSDVDVVWIERPMGRHVRSVADLSRVMGVYIAAVPPDIPVEEIGPTEWKKAIGLPGNCGKPVVIEWANAELARRAVEAGHPAASIGVADEHAADALGVAVACEVLSARALTKLEGQPRQAEASTVASARGGAWPSADPLEAA